MTFLLSVFSAIVYGAADFLGGMASRRTSTLRVVALAQAVGLPLVLAMLPFFPPAHPLAADFAWGAAAGIFGAGGVALLYRALAIGTMSVVAPVTAVFAAIIPIIVGVIGGERPSATAMSGIFLAVIAIAFVSRTRDEDVLTERPSRNSILVALIAGVVIGLFLVALDGASDEAGLWTLVIARISALGILLPLAAARGLRPPRDAVAPIICSGALDMLANILYLLAVMRGMLALVATLVSLYPAATVILARAVYGERLSLTQRAGVVLALAAVAIIGSSQG